MVMDVTRTLKKREPVAAKARVTSSNFYECNALALSGGSGGGNVGPMGSRLLAGTSKEEIIEFQVRGRGG